MFHVLLDLLFPRKSLTGNDGAWITEEERKRLRLSPTLLHKKELEKRGLKYIDAIVAAGKYDDSPLLKKAILTFKYKRIRPLGTELGNWMTDALHGLLIPPANLRGIPPVLCPVPLHWTRKMHRGFNQAELLASVIGEKAEWRVASLLLRKRATGHQAWRQKAERLTVLENVFQSRSTAPLPSYVVLVDDLSTTGATLDECAKTLKKAGVAYVAAIVAALG